jgi:hypothetical protein
VSLLVKERVSRLVDLVEAVLLVTGVVLLGISSLVPLRSGPGVLRGSPGTVRLNADVVDTSNDSEEAALTPVSAPRVAHIPVLGSVLHAKTND